VTHSARYLKKIEMSINRLIDYVLTYIYYPLTPYEQERTFHLSLSYTECREYEKERRESLARVTAHQVNRLTNSHQSNI